MTTARYFSAYPSDPASRRTPCPPKLLERWLQVRLGRLRLSPACPFRLLHTFLSLRPARHYPRLWIQRSSSERRRDLNPPDLGAAQRTLWPGLTSRARTSAATAPRLPAADQHRFVSLAERETSRFPSSEHPHMPGSPTTPGRPGTRARAPVRVAFRDLNHVGTRDKTSFAAQWLACALPCRRFAVTLAGANARLGAEVVSLRLPRGGLAPPTPCRSPGALGLSSNYYT